MTEPPRIQILVLDDMPEDEAMLVSGGVEIDEESFSIDGENVSVRFKKPDPDQVVRFKNIGKGEE